MGHQRSKRVKNSERRVDLSRVSDKLLFIRKKVRTLVSMVHMFGFCIHALYDAIIWCRKGLFLSLRLLIIPVYLFAIAVMILSRYIFGSTPLIRLLFYASVILYFLFFVGTSVIFDNDALLLISGALLVAACVAGVQFFWNVFSIVIPLIVSVVRLLWTAGRNGDARKHILATKHYVVILVARSVKNVIYLAIPVVIIVAVGEGFRLSRIYRERYVADLRSCNVNESIEKVKKATVAVVYNRDIYDLDPAKEAAHGTGVFIRKDGYVLTAAHVISNVNEDENVSIMFPDGGVLPALGVVYDEAADIAVLKIDGEDYPAVRLMSDASRSAILFEPLFALGIPSHLSEFNFEMLKLDGFLTWKNSLGMRLSASIGRLKSGYSGGPIFDVCGEVVGISTGGLHLPIPSLNREAFFTSAVSSETILERIKGKVKLE